MRNSKTTTTHHPPEVSIDHSKGDIILNLSLNLTELKPGVSVVIPHGEDEVMVRLASVSSPTNVAELYTMSIAYRKGPVRSNKS